MLQSGKTQELISLKLFATLLDEGGCQSESPLTNAMIVMTGHKSLYRDKKMDQASIILELLNQASKARSLFRHVVIFNNAMKFQTLFHRPLALIQITLTLATAHRLP